MNSALLGQLGSSKALERSSKVKVSSSEFRAFSSHLTSGSYLDTYTAIIIARKFTCITYN